MTTTFKLYVLLKKLFISTGNFIHSKLFPHVLWAIIQTNSINTQTLDFLFNIYDLAHLSWPHEARITSNYKKKQHIKITQILNMRHNPHGKKILCLAELRNAASDTKRNQTHTRICYKTSTEPDSNLQITAHIHLFQKHSFRAFFSLHMRQLESPFSAFLTFFPNSHSQYLM